MKALLPMIVHLLKLKKNPLSKTLYKRQQGSASRLFQPFILKTAVPGQRARACPSTVLRTGPSAVLRTGFDELMLRQAQHERGVVVVTRWVGVWSPLQQISRQALRRCSGRALRHGSGQARRMRPSGQSKGSEIANCRFEVFFSTFLITCILTAFGFRVKGSLVEELQ